MRFTELIVAAATLVVATAQTVQFTNSNFTGITVGTPFDITWSGASSNITLKLKNGPALEQNLVSVLVSGYSGTSYQWVPASNLVDGTYNLEIDHDSDPPNYSVEFTISGGLSSSSSVSVTTSTSSVASSTASVTTTSTSSASSASSRASSVSNSTGASTSATTKPTTTKSTSSSTSTATGSMLSAGNTVQCASSFAFVLLSLFAVAVLQ